MGWQGRKRHEEAIRVERSSHRVPSKKTPSVGPGRDISGILPTTALLQTENNEIQGREGFAQSPMLSPVQDCLSGLKKKKCRIPLLCHSQYVLALC